VIPIQVKDCVFVSAPIISNLLPLPGYCGARAGGKGMVLDDLFGELEQPVAVAGADTATESTGTTGHSCVTPSRFVGAHFF
jgi:hypothetical protein